VTSVTFVGSSIQFYCVVRRRPEGSGRRKSFLDNLVSDTKGLADELEPAREPLALEPFLPRSGMVVFFEDKTHFWGQWGTAPVGFNCAIFCGGRRDVPNQLGGDRPGSEFRNKIVNPIEQSAEEACCRMNIHITSEDNVILNSSIVNIKIGWRWAFEASLKEMRRFSALGRFLSGP
jgi:hypothetical protein